MIFSSTQHHCSTRQSSHQYSRKTCCSFPLQCFALLTTQIAQKEFLTRSNLRSSKPAPPAPHFTSFHNFHFPSCRGCGTAKLPVRVEKIRAFNMERKSRPSLCRPTTFFHFAKFWPIFRQPHFRFIYTYLN